MRKNVYIIGGARTAFLKSKNKPGGFSASDLAVLAGQTLLSRSPVKPSQLDEVILGCVMPSENETNIARVLARRLDCPQSTPAWTVQRNCASGMQALDSAFTDILLGRSKIVLAGGTEAMSRAPLMLKPALATWLADFSSAKSILQKMKLLLKLRPGIFSPIIALLSGLSDPLLKISMGKTAENVANHFGITRTQMDVFALESHQRYVRAQQEGQINFVNIIDWQGQLYNTDTGVRPDSSLENLASLKPIFEKNFGSVTAGNSSQVTDGAAILLLADEEAIVRNHWQEHILAKIHGFSWVGCDPAEMGLGPAHAVPPLLEAHGLQFSDIDYWEINEAFAAQVLGCVAAWQDDNFCKKELGLERAFGTMPMDRLNVNGGAIALGHPVGASGARIALELAHILKNKNARFGVATLCIGGGQGGAMLIENTKGAL